MTILNQIDTGGSHPWPKWAVGQLLGQVIVEGSRTIYYPRGRRQFTQTVSFWVQAWQGFGTGATARSMQARLYLLTQLEELASNRDLQPVFIQWWQSADPTASFTSVELHDGWYLVSDFQADYRNYVVTGVVKVTLNVERVSAPPPARVAEAFAKATLATTFVGSAATPLLLLAFPVGSTLGFSGSRANAEGSVPLLSAPATNPVLFGLSATLSNWWKGGLHAYDTINTGSNPIPTTGGVVNANWVEVFAPDHYWQGDCVVTNGFLLLLLQGGSSDVADIWLWNAALSTPAWQKMGNFDLAQPGGVVFGGTVAFTLERLGLEEVAAKVSDAPSSAADLVEFGLRLQRGSYLLRGAMTSFAVNYAGMTTGGLQFEPVPTGKQIVYNSGAIADLSVDSPTSLAAQTDYGFMGTFWPAAGTPFIAGYLWQNKPPAAQPAITAAGGKLRLGDGPALNGTTYWGFFGVPFSNIVNLQAEGESGTFDPGWTSVADAAASGGNTAQCASGTVASHSNHFGTSWLPPVGSYDVWFRVRVASNAGSTQEMALGLWDVTSATYVTGGFTNYAANQFQTTYTWVKVNSTSPLTLPVSTHQNHFRANTLATLGTNWFIDEAVLVPHTLTGGGGAPVSPYLGGPRDLFQQLLGDASVRQIRL